MKVSSLPSASILSMYNFEYNVPYLSSFPQVSLFPHVFLHFSTKKKNDFILFLYLFLSTGVIYVIFLTEKDLLTFLSITQIILRG
jgi:hypothetical protein